MRKLITLTAFSLAAFAARAQTTITQAAYASWLPGTDTFITVTGVNITSTATNATWDLSAATYGSPFSITKVPMSNAGLPSVSYGTAASYSFSALSYMSTIAYGINAQGVQRFGEVIARQPNSLLLMTGNALDTLTFTSQVIAYSSPRKVLAFSATAGSTWSSDYTWNTNFELTLTAALLNHVAGFRRTHAIETDSVKGWGKMRVKTAAGGTSGYMDVLAVKTGIRLVDSFFIGGLPAPANLLTAFGLVQGQVSSTYRIGYFRNGEVEPVLLVTYTNSNYDTQSDASTHASRLAPAASAVGRFTLEDEISVYPNPVIHGDLHITTSDAVPGHSWTYELTNLAGQKVSAGALVPVAGKASVHVGSQLTGLHYLRILKDGQAIAVKSLLLNN